METSSSATRNVEPHAGQVTSAGDGETISIGIGQGYNAFTLLQLATATATLERISTTDDLGRVADADLIIEAVFEDVGVKTRLWSSVDPLAPETAIFATNTSSISIDRLAAAEAAVVRALNAALPEQVRVVRAWTVPPTFHARRSALGKRYRYRLAWGPPLAPQQALRRAWVPHGLDAAAIPWSIRSGRRASRRARSW